ncbi:MAG TPA: DnaB-like helicase C-terminal domain-containing protein [Polyangiaceae bacterium]|nr:DnaB-like helicase C-terminal domain-containing protein [Polyangiaceae bacterium]
MVRPFLPSSFRARLPDFEKRARAAATEGRPGLNWGLAGLNDALGGAQGMGIVGGVAGARKTTFLQQVGWSVVRNNLAFFAHFSFEMPPGAIDAYTAAHLARIEKFKATGPLYEDPALAKQLEELTTAAKSFGDRGHTFGLMDAKSVEQVSEVVDRLRTHLKLDRGLVAIDSVHALAVHAGRGSRSERSALDAVLNELREFADSTGVAVLCSAQLTKRGAELESDFHFAQSAGADYTPDYTATLVTEREKPTRAGAVPRPLKSTLHIHKNRFGRENVELELKYHPAETRFEEAAAATADEDDDDA